MLALGQSAWAVGFRLPNQDPEAIARGNAFAATADNPSAIYYNPAGITQITAPEMSLGVYMISANTDYSSTKGIAHTDQTVQFVPQVYYVMPIKDTPLTLGLGVYAPYGLSLDWGKNTPFNTIAESGKLLYATVNPVIAWRVTPKLSLAIGPTLNYSDASLDNALLHFKGQGTGFGFNAGLRWQPYEQLSFGINYRYLTTIKYDGRSSVLGTPQVPTSGEIRFPQFVVGGISYRPTPDWNFEFDLDWTDWDNLNQTTFHGTFPTDITLLFNYQSTFMYEFGVTRQLGHGYFASTGYIYSENSSPSRNFNPLIPDANLHLGSIGFGHKGTRWDWAVGYHFALNPGRTVTGSQPSFGQTADGVYRTFNQAVNISFAYHF